MNRMIFTLFCAFLGITSLSFAEDGVLVVGTSSGYAPYVSLNAKGEYEGFDIDTAHELAAKLNKKCVIKDLGSMPSLLLALKQGKVDVVLWAVSITDDRLRNMEMIHYQGKAVSNFPLVFWETIPEGIRGFDDLGEDKFPGKTICVEAGTSQEDTLKEYPKIKLKFVDKISDALMEIKYRKSVATSLDPALIPSLTAKYKELKVVYFDLPKHLHVMGNGICVSKDNRELITKVRQAVDEMKTSGRIAELEKKWNVE